MPETTVTGWERRIRAHSDANGLELSKGRIQRLARRAFKAGIPYDGDEFRSIDYKDPTGDLAARRATLADPAGKLAATRASRSENTNGRPGRTTVRTPRPLQRP